ncbi:MAG: pitrilysin family protein [Steroidobacteraceae bacterium]
MNRFLSAAACAVLLAVPAVQAAAPASSAFPDVDIPYQRFVLANGLTLIVHEDHKAPIVAVNTYYHVGSKDEKPGRTGFAHLFEHLMFNGSENYNDEYFRALQTAGATKINGTTWMDRTNYFQNVQPGALDLALWMESDRMGHLLGVIDQAKLDEQRGVVQNEKRQGLNRPYGKVGENIALNTYPAGHPYSWTTIGSMEDLNAASLDDVKEWFRTWYGAGNVVLTIAGDVSAQDVKAKVEKYYGDIPGGPVLQRPEAWIAKMTGEKRGSMQDNVPQVRIVKTWNIPGYRTHDSAVLDIASSVLGGGKNSRLFKRLVYTDQIATSVSASISNFELGGQFEIEANVKPGGDPAAVEKALDEELARFLRDGPTAAELELVKVTAYAGFVRAAERVDGFGGKSTILAEGEVYAGRADFYKQQMAWYRATTPAEVQKVSKAWLSDGVYVLTISPTPEYKVAANGVDRSKPPVPGAAPSLKLPPMQRTTLSNGLKVVLVERHETPVVNLRLMFEGGSGADLSARPGTMSMMMNMLDEGTKTRSALQISEQSERIGAQIGAGAGLDSADVSMNALAARLPESLDLYADVLLNPSFPASELPRLKQQLSASIRQAKSDPSGIAGRLAPRLVYGDDHPYSVASRVTEEDIAAMDSAGLAAFYKQWLRPDIATLLIVGDTTLAQVKPLLEQRLGGWKAPASASPKLASAAVQKPTKPRVFLVNRTGAEQSIILGLQPGPVRSDPDFIALRAANTVLGGGFLSRINMNLREDKHWSYGAQSFVRENKGPGLFGVQAGVQTDKTAESIVEIRKELTDIVGTRKPTDKEILEAKNALTLTLPGNNETVSEVLGSYANVLLFGLPDSYWNDFVGKVTAMQPADFATAATKLIDQTATTWLVVGDLSKIEEKIRALNLGEVKVLDADGKVIR